MKKSISAIFWIIAVLTAPVALSAETALPESFKVLNFDRPEGGKVLDFARSLAKFHKVVINSTTEKIITSKEGGNKIGMDGAMKTLGFDDETKVTDGKDGDDEEALIDFIRESLVNTGPVFAIFRPGIYNKETASFILGYDNKTKKFDVWLPYSKKQDTLKYGEVAEKTKRVICYSKAEEVTASDTQGALSEIVIATAGLETYDNVKAAILGDKKLKAQEKEGLSKNLHETSEKEKAEKVTNETGYEMLTVALKTHPVIIIPQTSLDSPVLMFYKDSKTGNNVCRKLLKGVWVENPTASLSSANGKRLIESEGRWSLPLLRINTRE